MQSLFHEWDIRQRQDQLARELKQREAWHLPGGRLPRGGIFSWLKSRQIHAAGAAAEGEAQIEVVTRASQSSRAPASGRKAG